MRKILLSLFIILTTFITSFAPGGSVNAGAGLAQVDHNDNIKKQILDSVKILDDKVLDSIKNNNPDKIFEISSEEFKNNSLSFKETLASNNKDFKDLSFEYKDRYYCKVNNVGKFNITITTAEDDPFYITTEAINKDIFVSLIKTTSNKDDYLFTLIYIKENDEWKLRTFYAGNYSMDGMNAIDLYEKAKSLEAQGYKLPASTYMGLCSKLLRPASFIQYKKESEIVDYSKKLNKSITDEHTYPEKLKNTNNAEIYGFDVKYTKNDGIIPVVKYVTGIELGKKEELQKEADGMNKEVTDKYSGMKENFKYILYEAYSERPIDPKKTYNNYRSGVQQK